VSAGRLLVVTPSLGGGGAEHHLVRILPALAAEFDVHLATLKRGGALVSHVPGNVTRHEIDSRRWVIAAWRLRRLIRRIRPALLFGIQEAANIPLLMARRTLAAGARPAAAISIQTSLAAVLARSKPRTRMLLRQAINQLYPDADAIITTSGGIVRDLASIAPAASGHAAVIPNASVTEAIAGLAAAPCDHPFFSDGTAQVIVACGRLIEPKDYPTLLRAMVFVRATRPVRLIILGDGPLAGPLRALARDLGISDQVSFTGYVDNPYAFYARATLFVLSSQWEGFGNVIAEALACGAPVVSTDCPHGPGDILDRGRYGVLAPVGDPAALARAICSVLDDGGLRERLAAAGPERAALYTVTASGRAHVALLKRILARTEST
jgi:glycosyltransferase involved in cell wall biosynthesis